MFHIISKLLHVFTMPITWVCLLLLYGILYKERAKGRKALWLSFVALYLFSNEFIFNQVNLRWETPMTSIEEIQNKHEVGIVLGGYSSYAPGVGQVNFNDAADRFVAGMELYEQNKIKKLMFCGGHGNIFFDTDPEGLYSYKLATRLGIPKRDLLVESSSKNTWQNAVNCKAYLDSLNYTGSIVLITSGTHMKRSLACFKKAGFNQVTPYAVDGLSGPHKWLFDYLFLPNAYVLLNWNRVFHEWIGLATYKILGYN